MLLAHRSVQLATRHKEYIQDIILLQPILSLSVNTYFVFVSLRLCVLAGQHTGVMVGCFLDVGSST